MKVMVVHEPGEFDAAQEIMLKIKNALAAPKSGLTLMSEHVMNIPVGDETMEELRTSTVVRTPYFILQV
jgi:hypothetical protein